MSESTEKHLEKIVLELRDGNTRYSIEVLELKNKLDCAVKALQFYGDPETYIETHNDCYIKIEPKNDEELIRHYQHKKKEGWTGTVVVGGKRARLALEEIGK